MPFPKDREIFSGSAAAEGVWFYVGDTVYKTVHFGPLESGGIVDLRGSNKIAKPGDADDEAIAVAAFTSTAIGEHGIFDVTPLFRWVKFRKTTAGGAPEITVALLHEMVET